MLKVKDYKWKPTLLQRIVFPFLKTYIGSDTYNGIKMTYYVKKYNGNLYIIKQEKENE